MKYIKDVLCIYHANCPDGFASAWVVRKAIGANVVFYEGWHQQAPPDVKGLNVLLVDFAYSKEVIDEMLLSAASITILDHHVSAKDQLDPLLERGQLQGIIDLNKSAAMITWDWFYPSIDAPALLGFIQDRDLWRFNLDGTREITTGLSSYPFDYELWDKFMSYNLSELNELKRDGAAIERKLQSDIASLISTGVRRMVIAGYNVPVLNASSSYISDAGNILAKGEPFAACYWDHIHGRSFSLRSSEDGVDVSKIALRYGGGGHEKAAGFTVETGWEGY